ncbi:Membrane associated serine protease, rhomboid family [Oceanobacillus limi]|uniref:Membrane associated serine protease, rhomboid family n=1 Tax=Oceanobacillus limi TaxID=930131 RepID=A0A1I0H7E8_9BACI|nr:rhomboid family intramembrane serine protease [Oceanobacillus limi]SET79682.1 Membrane associated serine protease, rhomboid family [Oceanobacillus limi]
MFFRTERSIKEFMQFYPIVSWLVIIHLALWVFIHFLQLPLGWELYTWGSGINYLINQGEYWRLVTPIFLHVDLMHTLFNSFALVLFGPALEQMLGRFKFITAYLGAGIIANVGTYLIGPTEFYSHVGASGAIYGIFGIYIFMVAFRKHLIDSANSQIIMTIFIIGLVMTFLQPNINVYGHLFGFIGGFALAPIVLANVSPYSPWRNYRNRYEEDDEIQFDPNRWNKKRNTSKIKKNILWILLGILVLFGLISRIGLF